MFLFSFNFVIVTFSLDQENPAHARARLLPNSKRVAHLHGLLLAAVVAAAIFRFYVMHTHPTYIRRNWSDIFVLIHIYFIVISRFWPDVLHFWCSSTVKLVCHLFLPCVHLLCFVRLHFGPVSESRLFTFRSSFLSLFSFETNNYKHFSILDPFGTPLRIP